MSVIKTGLLDIFREIDSKSEEIDLSAIGSYSQELHRLMNDACGSLVELAAFCKRIGVSLKGNDLEMHALCSMLPDENGKRFVQGVFGGSWSTIDVDNVDVINAERRAYAEQFGISEEDVLRYEMMDRTHGPHVGIRCPHADCFRARLIRVSSAADMVRVEKETANERWFCQNHRKEAFSTLGVVSDELVPIMQSIARSPGLALKASGGSKGDIEFLESVGFLRIELVKNGNQIRCYKIFLTEAGQGYIASYLNSGYKK